MITPGSSIGDRYVVERELGAGGMATVFLARDIRHGRSVALKVLRPELAAMIGAARFLAEIRTTANLQHPHILPLYDSGEADGSVFYVMPFIDGESLRQRLTRERQLSIGEAVRIAGEVADAMDYAHRQGIVHRDIKPENIMLHDGRAIVADFGIALAISRTDGSTRMTETGMSLGTPNYMSPEQAMGERDVSARSDVYALGCVLYEMLVGEPPFTGPSPQAIVARVITESPRSLIAQRGTVPPHVQAAVEQALQKLPADRFASAGEFATAIRTASGTVPVATHAAAAVGAVRRQSSMLVASAAITAIAVAAAAWGWRRPVPDAPVTRYTMEQPDGPPIGFMQISPGGRLIYSTGAAINLPTRLFLKDPGDAEARLIPGTEGSSGLVAISPDEQSIAFLVVPNGQANRQQAGVLSRIPLGGGPPTALAQSVRTEGHAWLDNERVVFMAMRDDGRVQLSSVASTGGAPRDVWSPDSAVGIILPSPLPGGKLLATVVRPGGYDVWGIDEPTGKATLLVKDAMIGKYVAPGYLVHATTNGVGYVTAFDPATMKLRGPTVPAFDGVSTADFLAPQYAISRTGTFVALMQTAKEDDRYRATWVDRAGRESALDTTWTFNPRVLDDNFGWAISPDGTKLAIGLLGVDGSDIWVKQLPQGPLQRVTTSARANVRPRWTADGKSVTFLLSVGGRSGRQVRQKNADGTGSERVVAELPDSAFNILEAASTPNGDVLVRTGQGAQNKDISVLRPGAIAAQPLVASRFAESAIALSPDGKWLAYESNESGETEVFIRPYPATESARIAVSTNGGFAPLWNRNGSELFYMNRKREMIAVPVLAGATLQIGAAKTLFTLPSEFIGGSPGFYTPYDISPDGQRFLMVRRATTAVTRNRLVVTEHFDQILRERLRKP